MLEVLRYIAYIALNAYVKHCTKDQSNVKGVEGTLYRFQCIKCYVMICMSKTSKMVVAAFTQHCIQSTDLMLNVSKILQVYLVYLQHMHYLMVWLKRAKSQFLKTFCGLKIG